CAVRGETSARVGPRPGPGDPGVQERFVRRRKFEKRRKQNGIYMNVMFAMLNGWEVVAILAVVLILFGAKRLPELARGLGQGIREFKKSSREIQDEIQQAIDVDAPPPA